MSRNYWLVKDGSATPVSDPSLVDELCVRCDTAAEAIVTADLYKQGAIQPEELYDGNLNRTLRVLCMSASLRRSINNQLEANLKKSIGGES